MKLEGRSALVTGSSRNIGKAIALALAQEGANVVVNHRDSAQDAEAVASTIQEMGVRSVVIQADVTQRDQVQAMAKKILAEFGTIDILVNNVGTSTRVPFLEMTDEDWHQLIAINLHSVFYCTQTFIKGMVDRRWGRIINITGHASLRGSPNSAHVCAGKGGAVGFTRSIATEFAPYGITCNTVAPGGVEDTDGPRRPYYRDFTDQGVNQEWGTQWRNRVPMGRQATASEFASLCAYLASDDAAFLTGQMYLVNGGMMYL
ncbi:MAG: 3-oxoacyl-ACP reductase FabG [Chloroflexi bacterium]|nr:3-oxoacyl-ACP reductase FabG [Chloroflexota bacterium]